MTSCRFDSSSTGAASLHWCQHASWFDPVFQLEVISNSVDHYLSSFFVPQSVTTCDERDVSVVPLGTKRVHTHDGSIDVTHLKRDPDFTSITKFHRYCLLIIVSQLVSTRWYQIGIPAWFENNSFEVSWRTSMFVRAVVHQHVQNSRDISSFVLLIFVLIRRDRTVPSVILRDLTDGVSFPLTPLSLSLLLGVLSLLVSLKQQSLIMWPTRPHTKQLVFYLSVLLFPLLLWLLPFFIKTSISMSSGPLLLLDDLSHLLDTVRCVTGTEESQLSSSRRYPDFASGVGLAPMKMLCQAR